MFKKTVIAVLCLFFIVSVNGFSEVKTYTVKAYVVSNPDGGSAIKAILKPGKFKIPAGVTATIISYSWYDQKTGNSSKKLGKNIYCITTKSYMVDKKGNPLFLLPAGKYKFTVGGYVGAVGTLTYQY